MTEDNSPQRIRVSSSESITSADSSISKQRKKRKWDQPAESLVSAGVVVPGVLPLGNVGSLPGISPVSGASLMNAIYGTPQHVLLAPLIQQHATALVQKIQPKIQEELIAREIVINDAESAVRYKLTKRQTQEEIQKCTGAVVITRGKYRPPNAPPDGEKPLYLHISAGAHLETTSERIKAVDQAAAMVEEMLKQGSVNNGGKVPQLLSTCVFLGFEPDPSLNITARIRGPNDQYVNHIMNETGASVLLRGRGSGNFESANSEGQQPLHLFLSSSNPKGLDHAKLLAENLLDTICAECGASRVSSCKVYGAVPPPQQLLAGVHSSGNELKNNAAPTASLTSSIVDFVQSPPISTTSPGITTILPLGTVPQSSRLLNTLQSQPTTVCYPQPSVGTSYNGYGGIYPQATPLQQVALALRQSTSPVVATVSPITNAVSTSNSSTNASKERQPPQRRKFQELSVAPKGPAKPHQGSGFASHASVKSTSTMPAPVKLVHSSSNGVPPPAPRSMPPPPPPRNMPPPPPKFNSSIPVQKVHDTEVPTKSDSKAGPDTLMSLVAYGDEDEDEEDELKTTEEQVTSNSYVPAAPKPFWAV